MLSLIDKSLLTVRLSNSHEGQFSISNPKLQRADLKIIERGKNLNYYLASIYKMACEVAIYSISIVHSHSRSIGSHAGKGREDTGVQTWELQYVLYHTQRQPFCWHMCTHKSSQSPVTAGEKVTHGKSRGPTGGLMPSHIGEGRLTWLRNELAYRGLDSVILAPGPQLLWWGKKAEQLCCLLSVSAQPFLRGLAKRIDPVPLTQETHYHTLQMNSRKNGDWDKNEKKNSFIEGETDGWLQPKTWLQSCARSYTPALYTIFSTQFRRGKGPLFIYFLFVRFVSHLTTTQKSPEGG